MQRGKAILVILLIVIIASSIYFSNTNLLSPTNFRVGNLSSNLNKNYGPNNNVTGWINISFSDLESLGLSIRNC
jgi:hypothetical protein